MKTTVRKVDNLVDPSKPWSLSWQSASMGAPAFWYYATEEEALKDEEVLLRNRRKDISK